MPDWEIEPRLVTKAGECYDWRPKKMIGAGRFHTKEEAKARCQELNFEIRGRPHEGFGRRWGNSVRNLERNRT